MSDKAVLAVINKQTKEHNALLTQHNILLKVHVKTVNDLADTAMAFAELKKQDKDLRALVIRWERDNERLQESLDQAERELMDK